MLIEKTLITGIAILAITCALSLNACVNLGLASVEAGAAILAGGAAAATQSDEYGATDIEVRGNYENGFWFDRDLFFVWVTANTSVEAERVARLTATVSCSTRNKPFEIIDTKRWQERRLFIPVIVDRFPCEIRYRCAGAVEIPS